MLDAIEVHDDVADVTEHPHPRTIGGDVDILGNVGAVEHQRIGAGAAIDHVAAVTRIPDEGIVAGAELRGVVAFTTVDEVVAVAADQLVGAVAAGDGVVAGTAIDGEADDCSREKRRTDVVVAGTRADGQHVVGGFRTIDVHLLRQP